MVKNKKAANKNAAPFSYTSRKGYRYFIHQGTTKTGKTKYLMSRKPDGALSQVPAGYEITESINAVVSVQKPKPVIISPADLERVRKKVSSLKHLEHYKVVAKGNTIIVYEPPGLNAVRYNEKADIYSMTSLLPTIKRFNLDWNGLLADTAAKLGVTVAKLKKADAISAAKKRKETAGYLIQQLQFSPVLRFTWDGEPGNYAIHRRCFRGGMDWLLLSYGPIAALVNKYIKHIGKESFFELE